MDREINKCLFCGGAIECHVFDPIGEGTHPYPLKSKDYNIWQDGSKGTAGACINCTLKKIIPALIDLRVKASRPIEKLLEKYSLLELMKYRARLGDKNMIWSQPHTGQMIHGVSAHAIFKQDGYHKEPVQIN